MKVIERLQAQLLKARTVAEKLADVQAGRELTAEEQTEFDTAIGEIKTTQEAITKAVEAEQVLIKSAQPLVLPELPAPAVHVDKVEDTKLEKGLLFAVYARAMLAGRGDPGRAHEIVRAHYPKQPSLAALLKGQALGVLPGKMGDVLKAAIAPGTTTDVTYASALVVAQNMTSEFIELLRPQTILGRITGYRRVPFNVSIPRQTGALTANWVGENAPKPVSRPSFDRITMPWSKAVIITAFTDELFRFSDPNVDLLVRDDMIATTAVFLDKAYADYTKTAVAGVNPKPINGDGAGVAINPLPSSGDTVAEITADLSAALNLLANNNIAMTAPYWLMSTRTRNYLSTLRTAQDLFAFRDELQAGTLLGIPVVSSTSVPTNLGLGTDESFITLMDASEQLFAQDDAIDISMSDQASLMLSDAPLPGTTELTSLWQQNLIGMKSEQYIHWLRRRDGAVTTITGVTY